MFEVSRTIATCGIWDHGSYNILEGPGASFRRLGALIAYIESHTLPFTGAHKIRTTPSSLLRRDPILICSPTTIDSYTVLYYTVQYCTVLYCTILYYTILYSTLLYSTLLYYTILYTIHYTILYCTVLYCTVLYCTVLYYTILYSTILYHTTAYSTVLYHSPSKRDLS